jgi:hypothetical protein
LTLTAAGDADGGCCAAEPSTHRQRRGKTDKADDVFVTGRTGRVYRSCGHARGAAPRTIATSGAEQRGERNEHRAHRNADAERQRYGGRNQLGHFEVDIPAFHALHD